MGKHGVGKPYVNMRNTMMLWTVVTPNKKVLSIKYLNPHPMPVVMMAQMVRGRNVSLLIDTREADRERVSGWN
jgi:hypothetical protein